MIGNEYIPEGWRTEKCSNCSECGLISAYTFSGDDFLGADDCPDCGGKGFIYIHNKSGVITEWPGGPFLGRLSKEERKELAKEVKNV